jgi:hypothetical protein
MYVDFHVRYPLFLSDFNETEFSRQIFEKKIQMPNFMKICPMGAKLFHVDGWTDRQTDMTKLIVWFSSRIIVGRIFGVWELLSDKLQQPNFTIWPSLNHRLGLALHDYIAGLNAVNHLQRLIDNTVCLLNQLPTPPQKMLKFAF